MFTTDLPGPVEGARHDQAVVYDDELVVHETRLVPHYHPHPTPHHPLHLTAPAADVAHLHYQPSNSWEVRTVAGRDQPHTELGLQSASE